MDSMPPTKSEVSTEHVDNAGPIRVFAFDTQGVCAQLFSKQLSQHLNLGTISHPYILAATIGPDRIHTKLECSEETRRIWDDRVANAPPKVSSITYQTATEKFLREADKLEQKGKILFVKEYAAFVMKHEIMTSAIRSHATIVSKLMNPTILPDELLKLITPIIFIRHPAIVLPSCFRAANSDVQMGSHSVDDEDFSVWTSLRWSRIIFDYLRNISHQQQSSGVQRHSSTKSTKSTNGARRPSRPPVVATKPYVIDAVDAIYNTQATLEMICRLLGLEDEDDDQSPASKKYYQRAYQTLKRGISSNVIKTFSSNSGRDLGGEAEDRSSGPDEQTISLDVEVVKWRKEFGEDIAAALRRKVDEELPHYQYLRSFRLPVRPSSPRKPLNPSSGNPYLNARDSLERRRSALNPGEITRNEVDYGGPLRVISTAVDLKRFSEMGTPTKEVESFLGHSSTR